MTPPADAPRPDDELLSAQLDGELTAEEVARLEGRTDLAARRAELAAVRDLVAVPVSPPAAAARDAAIVRAVEAATADTADGGADGGAADRSGVAVPVTDTVVPLRRRGRTTAAAAIAAAAAALVVGVMIGALAPRQSEKFEAVSSAIDGGPVTTTRRAAPGADKATDEPGPVTGGAPSTLPADNRSGGRMSSDQGVASATQEDAAATARVLASLGTFSTPDELRLAAIDTVARDAGGDAGSPPAPPSVPAASTTTSAASAGPTTTMAPLPGLTPAPQAFESLVCRGDTAGSDGSAVVLRAGAVLQDQPVIVVVTQPGSGGPLTIRVFAAATCDLVLQLAG